jgi:hypothetical protein
LGRAKAPSNRPIAKKNFASIGYRLSIDLKNSSRDNQLGSVTWQDRQASCYIFFMRQARSAA